MLRLVILKKGVRQTLSNKGGFTLVELLVSMSIIALLTAILLPNFNSARERAKDAKKKENLTTVKNALRLYYNDNQSYPAGTDESCGDLAGLATYIPNMSTADIGCTYSQLNSGDGFLISVGLDSGAASEDVTASQHNCGLGNPLPTPGVFMLCSN